VKQIVKMCKGGPVAALPLDAPGGIAALSVGSAALPLLAALLLDARHSLSLTHSHTATFDAMLRRKLLERRKQRSVAHA
jgi:hypothetical protein